MSFDIVNTLEIPQGATELTTSQLKQISGGHDCEEKKHKHNKCNKEGDQHKKKNKENNCDNSKNDN
jgi:bacteriocin-like protein